MQTQDAVEGLHYFQEFAPPPPPRVLGYLNTGNSSVFLLFKNCTLTLFFVRSLFSASPIVEYIDSQFDKYLQQELKIRRTLNSYNDTRVHVCLYFVSPTGHSYVVIFCFYDYIHLFNF